MGLKELTIEEQIEVLIYAKNYYISYFVKDDEYFNIGMCYSINKALEEVFKLKSSCLLHTFIPTFTLNHLYEACLTKKVEMVLPENNCYWWKTSDNKSRIAAFNYLIKELENKL